MRRADPDPRAPSEWAANAVFFKKDWIGSDGPPHRRPHPQGVETIPSAMPMPMPISKSDARCSSLNRMEAGGSAILDEEPKTPLRQPYKAGLRVPIKALLIGPRSKRYQQSAINRAQVEEGPIKRY